MSFSLLINHFSLTCIFICSNNNYNNNKKKLNESEKKYKYVDLDREQKKFWNMKIAVIPIVIGVLNIVSKDWERDWRTWK